MTGEVVEVAHDQVVRSATVQAAFQTAVADDEVALAVEGVRGTGAVLDQHIGVVEHNIAIGGHHDLLREGSGGGQDGGGITVGVLKILDAVGELADGSVAFLDGLSHPVSIDDLVQVVLVLDDGGPEGGDIVFPLGHAERVLIHAHLRLVELGTKCGDLNPQCTELGFVLCRRLVLASQNAQAGPEEVFLFHGALSVVPRVAAQRDG